MKKLIKNIFKKKKIKYDKLEKYKNQQVINTNWWDFSKKDTDFIYNEEKETFIWNIKK